MLIHVKENMAKLSDKIVRLLKTFYSSHAAKVRSKQNTVTLKRVSINNIFVRPYIQVHKLVPYDSCNGQTIKTKTFIHTRYSKHINCKVVTLIYIRAM